MEGLVGGGNFILGAEGRTRTDTEVALQQFLRLPRLPLPPLRLMLSYFMPKLVIAQEGISRDCLATYPPDPLPLAREEGV